MEMSHSPFVNMDDFDHSVHIAERDWSTFFQECEECDLLQGTLASLDDSGMSDDDIGMELEELEPQPSSDGQLNLQGSTSAFKVPENGGVEDVTLLKVPAPEESAAVLDCSSSGSVTLPKSIFHPECQNCTDYQGIVEKATEPNDTSSSMAKGNVCQETDMDLGKVIEAASSEPIRKLDYSGISAEPTRSLISDGKWSVKPLTENKWLMEEGELHSSSPDGSKPPALHGFSNKIAFPETSIFSGMMDPRQGDGWGSKEQIGNQLGPKSVFSSSEDSQTDSLIHKEMISESLENFTSSIASPRREKERWFVTVDIGMARSRARGSTSVKKKKKKKISRDPCELGLGCDGRGPVIRNKPELKAPASRSTDHTNETSLSSHQPPTHTPKNCSFFIKFISEKPAIKKSPKSNGIVPSETCKNGNTLQKHAENSTGNKQSNAVHHELSCGQESTDTSLSDITETKLTEPNNSLYLPEPSHGKTLAYASCKLEGITVHNIQQGIKLSHSTGKKELQLLDSNNEYEKYEHKKTDTAMSFKECEDNHLAKKDVDGVLRASCRQAAQKEKLISVFLPEDVIACSATPNFNSLLNPAENTLAPTTVNKNRHVDVGESCLDGALLQVTGVRNTIQESYLGIYHFQNHNEISGEVDCSGSRMTNRVCTIDESEKNEGHYPNQDRNVHILDMNKFTHSIGLPLLDPVETKVQELQTVTDLKLTHSYQTNCSPKTESSQSQEPLASDPEHPVYAISSFWDEMEKLTISDILQLKLVGHTYSTRTFPHMQDSVVVDTSDADDAGYFTNLDESKPDYSTAEVSTFSDFEEEGIHSLNISTYSNPEPQGTKNGRSSDNSSSWDDVWNKEVYLNAGTGKESTKRTISCSEDPFPHFHCSEVCKYGCNQKKSQNSKTAYQMNTGDDGNSDSLSVPEMYDYLFFESKPGNFCSSPMQNNETVPIFSSSQSIRQSLQFPEVYDCLLLDDSLVQVEDEEDYTPIRVVTRFDSRISDTAIVPDSYEHFCTDSDWRGNLFWRHPLSLRRTCFTWGNFSWLWYDPVFRRIEAIRGRQSLFRTIRPTSSQDVQHCGADICYLEKHVLSGHAEQKQAVGKLKTALSVPRKMGCLLSLKQSDMCLVCIAFASWLLRSVEPQNVDTWRNVLLANISAVYAIRYLRRYIRDDTTTDKL